MRAPSIPADEAERLADLREYGILDSSAARVFDEIAALAAAVCGTPYAAVSFVDQDRLWFKAEWGTGVGTLPRAESIGAHAILQREFFEVPDLEVDERFAGNPALRGPPALRFYAAAQLLSPRGHAIGTLSVLDAAPRRLTEPQRQSLQRLAGVLMTVLEAGRQDRLRTWLGALIDKINDNILVIDPQTFGYLYANASALKTLGYTLAQLRGMSVLDVSRQRTREELRAFVLALQSGTPQVVFEDVRQRASGESYPAEVHWQLLSTDGRPVVVSLAQDITNRKQMDRMKDEFISVVNHELRTPLTSVHGAVKLLQQGAGGTLPEKASRLVALAGENTDRLRRIIDDILDLEQLASGRMQLRVEAIEARQLLEQVARAYEPAARAAGVALAVDAPAGLRLRGDPQRVDQVLANLVSNAIKFAPRDSRVALSASAAADQRVRLEVVDGGPGIPEEFRGRIFQRFAQADMNTRRAKGGSGLGLSIAKQMAEYMGGAIGYTSEPGRTCFHVILPEVTS